MFRTLDELVDDGVIEAEDLAFRCRPYSSRPTVYEFVEMLDIEDGCLDEAIAALNDPTDDFHIGYDEWIMQYGSEDPDFASFWLDVLE